MKVDRKKTINTIWCIIVGIIILLASCMVISAIQLETGFVLLPLLYIASEDKIIGIFSPIILILCLFLILITFEEGIQVKEKIGKESNASWNKLYKSFNNMEKHLKEYEESLEVENEYGKRRK